MVNSSSSALMNTDTFGQMVNDRTLVKTATRQEIRKHLPTMTLETREAERRIKYVNHKGYIIYLDLFEHDNYTRHTWLLHRFGRNDA